LSVEKWNTNGVDEADNASAKRGLLAAAPNMMSGYWASRSSLPRDPERSDARQGCQSDAGRTGAMSGASSPAISPEFKVDRPGAPDARPGKLRAQSLESSPR